MRTFAGMFHSAALLHQAWTAQGSAREDWGLNLIPFSVSFLSFTNHNPRALATHTASGWEMCCSPSAQHCTASLTGPILLPILTPVRNSDLGKSQLSFPTSKMGLERIMNAIIHLVINKYFVIKQCLFVRHYPLT